MSEIADFESHVASSDQIDVDFQPYGDIVAMH
jgi:hypothetical protein